MAKKYASLDTLRTFLDNLKETFSDLSHKHTLSDITDYKVDSTLSSSSVNPVQNKTINAEFDAISQAMGALETAIDGKSDSSHTHDSRYYTESEIDSKLSTVNTSITNITSGSTPVKEAEHADSADTATNATNANHATSADSATSATSATKATQDGNGKVISSTYETKTDATKKLDEAKTYTDTVASGKSDTTHNHDTAYDIKGSAADVQSNLDVVSDTLDSHTGNSNIHVTTTNKSQWNTAYTHSQAAHARTDATKVEDSTTNGNIKINGTETNVYSHPNSGVTAGTYKSVTVNAQGHVTSGTNPTTLSGYGITDAETKTDATTKLNEAKSYADSAATKVKNDLLNGAGTAYDTLKELGDLIDDNVDAIEALETVAAGKANATHSHAISDVTNLQSTLDGKAAKSHGTHVSYSTTAPVMDGTASVGSASTVARSDHKHPTDTSRASKTEFDTHVADTTKHITSTERTNWNAAKTHADSAHAPSNAEKNQNAFSNVKVGTTTITADTTTDTLELVGSNVTITPDATNDKVTIAVADGSTGTKGIVKLTNSTSSTSTTTAATPSSVKSAYDLANTAKTNAATAQSKADSAYSLAESKVDSLSDLGITATATELNYVDGVKSNVQTQLDQLQVNIDSIPQSDWSQSDSTKLDYIKNRTHWSKTESTVVSEETVDTSDYTYYFTTPFALNVGQTYIVVFDGTTYNCVAFRDNGNYNRATIGGSYSNYSTYPFSIYVKSNGDTCITSEVNSTHTVKVTNVNETVQKLDEKYIPDTFAKSADMEVMINDVEDNLLDKINNKANTSDITSGFVANVVSTLNTSSWKGVVYGDGKYVAVNYENFAYSTDGINWTYGTLPISASGIAYGNSMYCAYGYSDINVCYSTDGINWNTASTNYNSNKFSIYFLNNKFFISAGYAILSSSNCTSWSKFELGESCTLYGGAYGNGVYIMSGYGDTFISTNGTSWTKTTALSTTENYGSIFFVDEKFIAIAHGTTSYGASNKIAYSTNGTSWTYGTLPISAKWVEGSYCNGTFMIAGYQSLAYSNNGVNWKVGSLPEGWNTIETMGSGNEFLFFQGSGNEVAIARQNPYDLVFKADTNWTQIYDSGAITEPVNAFANIDISGYKKLRVVVKCVNDGTNSTSKNGAVTFTATNGTKYQFPCWTTMFTNADYTSGNMATFEINNGWLVCSGASRMLKTSNFLGTEGGTADNLPSTGSGIMKCTSKLSTMMVSALDQDTNYYLLAGSRVMVWGSVI